MYKILLILFLTIIINKLNIILFSDKLLIKHPDSIFNDIKIPNIETSKWNYKSTIFFYLFIKKLEEVRKFNFDFITEKIYLDENTILELRLVNYEYKDKIYVWHSGMGENENSFFFDKLIKENQGEKACFCRFIKEGIITDNNNSGYSVFGYSKNIDLILNHLVKLNYRNIILISNSLGCNMVLKYLSDPNYIKPKELKLVNILSAGPNIKKQMQELPFYCRSKIKNSIYNNIKGLEKYSDIPKDLNLVDLVYQIEKINTNLSFDEFYNYVEFTKEEWLQISVPTIFINNKDDNVAKFKYVEKEYNIIKENKNILLVKLDKGYHCMNVEIKKNRITFNQNIYNFIFKITDEIINYKEKVDN